MFIALTASSFVLFLQASSLQVLTAAPSVCPLFTVSGLAAVSGNCLSVVIYDGDEGWGDGTSQNLHYGAVHGSASINLSSDISYNCAGYMLQPGY